MPDPHASSDEVAVSDGSDEVAVSDGSDELARWRVLLPLPLAGTYDYLAPPELDLSPGDFVEVPLGRRRLVGVVWGKGGREIEPERLKPILAKLVAPALTWDLRRFIDWVAAYTMSSPGAVLRMAMSVPEALSPPRPVQGFVLNATAPGLDALTPVRRRVVDVVKNAGAALTAADIARRASCSAGVVRDLAALGLLTATALPRKKHNTSIDWRSRGPLLDPQQHAAVEALSQKLESGRFSVTLIDGVTGSGKTEVYFASIAEALAQGRQVLVLLPEIALSAQWLRRFAARFGTAPALWHSDLGQSERRSVWRAVAEGEAQVVVGARSALFLPFARLGLIIVDEEHDASFKQEEGVIYQARDMAVVRASLLEIPIILVSATPSLETVTNVARGRYERLHLALRHGGASLPEI
ncbi:MAG TPA: primosomal protein N', partial [Stellaceae bacterium]|nr:primosomal protein N' [Stellaceae bacterium]